MKKELIWVEDIKAAASVLRAVNHDLRQKILQLLEENKKLTVTDIYVTLELEQSVCSQHLSILKKEGILGVERAEKYRYYYIVHKRLQEINGWAKQLIINNKPS